MSAERAVVLISSAKNCMETLKEAEKPHASSSLVYPALDEREVCGIDRAAWRNVDDAEGLCVELRHIGGASAIEGS